jgi:methylmalonyl-CoA/ethylmalonyl-CoA epimerase
MRPVLDLKLHHIGLVAREIEEQRAFYVQSLGYRPVTDVIHDPLQTAYVQFLSIPGADHYLELVAPDGPTSKLAKASRSGLPLNHLCYSTAQIEVTLRELATAGALAVQDPVPAVAFGGRRIAWILTPDQLLTELVERGPPGTL